MEYRIERDTLGEVAVPADKYWGAQTERSRQNFSIGPAGSMPHALIVAYAELKRACAYANCDFGVIDSAKRDLIAKVCAEIVQGKLDEHFPLVIWQTGSGTQTNMNLNEVIANRAKVLAGSEQAVLHPNDDVNASQSSNDSFPSAMHIAAYSALVLSLLPALVNLRKSLQVKVEEFAQVIKVGRTHGMDATPLTLGQEFSAFVEQLQMGISRLQSSLPTLAEIAIGGTAVGTGLNSPAGFDQKVCQYLRQFTLLPIAPVANKFAALAGHEALVNAHAAIKLIALTLTKIASDIRLLGTGPRAGLGELHLPANEPGSSIMPGKVNPTQCEALLMVCAQIQGNDTAIGFAQAQGQLQLNTFKPLIISNFLQSAQLLSDAVKSFDQQCVQGITANTLRIDILLDNNLMLATALNPHIGYDRAAKIALKAHQEGTSLKQAALESGLVTEAQYHAWVNPANMLTPYAINQDEAAEPATETGEPITREQAAAETTLKNDSATGAAADD